MQVDIPPLEGVSQMDSILPGGEFNAGILQGIPAFPAFPVSLSLEGVSQMVYIVPERLLALVRPAFDLVLRRIRSLKRCVQA